MIPCQELKAKRLIRVKTPKKEICIKTKYWIIWVQNSQNFFSVRELKVNRSVTQKDTMDRGAWIKKKSKRKACRRTQMKGQKSKSTKSAKWHGNEEQMNISVYHMLWSCGVLAGSCLKTEEKMKLIFLSSKELSWLWNIGFHFHKLDHHQWLKVHIFAIWEIQTSRIIQHVGFIFKQFVT